MDYPDLLKIGSSSYQVHYESVLKASSSVRIRRNGVVIRLSRFVRGRHRDEMVRKFLDWAIKRLEKAGRTDFVEPIYEDGGRICTHNKVYEISIRTEERSNARSYLENGCQIVVVLSLDLSEEEKSERGKFLAEKVIMDDQKVYLENVLRELNELYFKEFFNLYRFKRMHSRFGSCSSKGNINIAFRLLFAPREVFRYVCAHELAHLKVFNHSRKFWELVEEAVPEYKEHERWLREKGFMLG